METPKPSNFNININPSHLASQFFVEFKNPHLIEEESQQLSMQVATVVVNLAGGQIIMVIEHASNPGFLKIIESIAKHESELSLNMMDGQTGRAFDTLRVDVGAAKHEFLLDHNNNDVARHIFIFEIV